MRSVLGTAACAVLLVAGQGAGPQAGQTTEPVTPGMDQADAYYHYSLARQAWQREDFTAALGHLQRAIAADPASAELVMDLARLHFELDDQDDALAAAKRAVEIDPDAPEPRRLLADTLLTLAMKDGGGNGLLDQAGDAYRDVIRIAPEDADARLSLARVQMAGGDLTGALEQLMAYPSTGPAADEAAFLSAQTLVKLGRQEEAQALLEKTLLSRPHLVQHRVALVELLETRGDLAKAIEVASPLLEQEADQVRVHLLLARLSQKQDKPMDTFEHLRVMSRLMAERPGEYGESDRAEIRVRMVLALIDAGRSTDALAQAQQGMEDFPGDRRFVLRGGETLILMGREQDAETLFLGPRGGAAPDDATRGQISDAYLSAGARRERAGDGQQAEKYLLKSIDWNPSNAAALNYLGFMLAERGERLDESIGYIRRALAQDPDNGAYLDSLGWAYFKKGEYREAEKHLDRALSAMAEEPEIHAHLGDLYFAMGRTQDAVRAWREALERGIERADEIRARLSKAERSGGGRP